MPNNFWANPNLEPKRQNRWVIYMEDPFYSWIAKSVNRPNYQMTPVTHQWLNHQFKFPGRITWQPVTVTVIDPGSDNGEIGSTLALYQMLLNAGYVYPENEDQTSSISKAGAINALGQVRIQELDVAGKPIEEFTLFNSFVSTANLGELTYESENIVTLSLTIEYDFARFNLVP